MTNLTNSVLQTKVRKGDNKSMGSAVFDIAEVLGARGSTKGKKIRGGGMYVQCKSPFATKMESSHEKATFLVL